MNWEFSELLGIKTDDLRLERRVLRTVSMLAKAEPRASIKAAAPTHADMVAAYRLLGNDSISTEVLFQPHYARSAGRIKRYKSVTVAHDTTEIDATRPNKQVRNMGTTSAEDKYDYYVHASMAYSHKVFPWAYLTWKSGRATQLVKQACNERKPAPNFLWKNESLINGLKEP